ncbi:hypothetical protein EON81_26850, partial [bacterium]
SAKNALKTVLGKPITSQITGESWELSAVKGDVSIVANGSFKGTSLSEIIEAYPEGLLGTEVYKRFGKEFPLLFKYLDAREDLSIQVHPNDELAKKEDIERTSTKPGRNRQWLETVHPSDLCEEDVGRDHRDDARKHHRGKQHEEEPVTSREAQAREAVRHHRRRRQHPNG